MLFYFVSNVISHMPTLLQLKNGFFHSSERNTNTTAEVQKFNTRHLFWHNGSSISNHSHLLRTVNTLYDKTIHMTNTEDRLIHEMHGMQRLPSLMQANSTITSNARAL